MVPENRSNPAARLIALPVKRIRSGSSHPAEPIFYLGGGPGISNMGFKPPAWLLAEHDIVLVGYRGVDGTPKLDCPEVSKAVMGVGGDLLSPASLDGMGKAMGACAARLQRQGVDLAGYTIPEVVEDMESARTALGYTRIDLLSESYGTRVAQIYADMHPASLLRSAMIGVNPPGHFYWEPAVVDAQVAYYASIVETGGRSGRARPGGGHAQRQPEHAEALAVPADRSRQGKDHRFLHAVLSLDRTDHFRCVHFGRARRPERAGIDVDGL